jgi:hypothetical protein
LPLAISRSLMIAVSAWEPQPLEDRLVTSIRNGVCLDVLGRAVSRSSVLDGQAWHGDSIGALDLGYYTVGRNSSRKGEDESW